MRLLQRLGLAQSWQLGVGAGRFDFGIKGKYLGRDSQWSCELGQQNANDLCHKQKYQHQQHWSLDASEVQTDKPFRHQSRLRGNAQMVALPLFPAPQSKALHSLDLDHLRKSSSYCPGILKTKERRSGFRVKCNPATMQHHTSPCPIRLSLNPAGPTSSG